VHTMQLLVVEERFLSQSKICPVRIVRKSCCVSIFLCMNG
jgi:hypothetical protein